MSRKWRVLAAGERLAYPLRANLLAAVAAVAAVGVGVGVDVRGSAKGQMAEGGTLRRRELAQRAYHRHLARRLLPHPG